MGFIDYIPGLHDALDPNKSTFDRIMGGVEAATVGLVVTAGAVLAAPEVAAAAGVAGAEMAAGGVAGLVTEGAVGAVVEEGAATQLVALLDEEIASAGATELEAVLYGEEVEEVALIGEDATELHPDAIMHDVDLGAVEGGGEIGELGSGSASKFSHLLQKGTAALGAYASEEIIKQIGDVFTPDTSEPDHERFGPVSDDPHQHMDDEGPGQMGGDSSEVSGGSFDPMGAVGGFVKNITKTLKSALKFNPGRVVIDSNLPDAVIFDVMRRNDTRLHAASKLYAHDSRYTDVLYVRGTSNMAEWRGNVAGSNDQQLLQQQTEQVLKYLEGHKGIRHIIGHSRGGAIAHDAAHISGRMFCGIDAAMVIARGAGALRARNINKAGGFDRTLDPIGPIERTNDGSENNMSEKIHHAELGKYTDEFAAKMVGIPPQYVATGFERSDNVQNVSKSAKNNSSIGPQRAPSGRNNRAYNPY